MKFREKINESKQTILTTLKGVRHAALTISLVIVTAFAIWGIYNVELRDEYRAVISLASAVMVIFAGSLVVEVLKRIGKE